MPKNIIKTLQDFLAEIPKPDEKICFANGYDCEMNGANTTNCHFSLFGSPERTKAWERGKEAARLTKRAPDVKPRRAVKAKTRKASRG